MFSSDPAAKLRAELAGSAAAAAAVVDIVGTTQACPGDVTHRAAATVAVGVGLMANRFDELTTESKT